MGACLGIQALLVRVQRQVLSSQRRDVGKICEGHSGACHCQADAHDACSDEEHTPSQSDASFKLGPLHSLMPCVHRLTLVPDWQPGCSSKHGGGWHMLGAKAAVMWQYARPHTCPSAQINDADALPGPIGGAGHQVLRQHKRALPDHQAHVHQRRPLPPLMLDARQVVRRASGLVVVRPAALHVGRWQVYLLCCNVMLLATLSRCACLTGLSRHVQ